MRPLAPIVGPWRAGEMGPRVKREDDGGWVRVEKDEDESGGGEQRGGLSARVRVDFQLAAAFGHWRQRVHDAGAGEGGDNFGAEAEL